MQKPRHSPRHHHSLLLLSAPTAATTALLPPLAPPLAPHSGSVGGRSEQPRGEQGQVGAHSGQRRHVLLPPHGPAAALPSTTREQPRCHHCLADCFIASRVCTHRGCATGGGGAAAGGGGGGGACGDTAGTDGTIITLATVCARVIPGWVRVGAEGEQVLQRHSSSGHAALPRLRRASQGVEVAVGEGEAQQEELVQVGHVRAGRGALQVALHHRLPVYHW
ncbi:unnamed protein product [Closterium sp. NIES-54]